MGMGRALIRRGGEYDSHGILETGVMLRRDTPSGHLALAWAWRTLSFLSCGLTGVATICHERKHIVWNSRWITA